MKSIELKRNMIYSGNLILVNAQHRFFEQDTNDFAPADSRYPNILLKREAAEKLRLVFDEIGAGNSIVPVSGYRSSDEQTEIYNNSLKENGEVFTRKYVALPDHSEHQTGLAIDLGLNTDSIDFIRPYFPYDGICDKFRSCAADFGFIERYAADKEDITGISHEPWHFRYVGFPHSRIIAENRLSLEEYIVYIKDYRGNNRLIYEQNSTVCAEIYYIPADSGRITVNSSHGSTYQISGNNTDGFIITVWRNKNV